MPLVIGAREKNVPPPSVMRYGLTPKNVPYTKHAPSGQSLFGLPKLGSTSACPPSPLVTSNQVWELTDLRSVPLSCVPPQKRSESTPGATLGTVWMEVNCVIARPVRCSTAPVAGSTVPFRSCQSTSLSGRLAVGRPPRCALNHTPPSLPISTCLVLVGS